MNTVEDAMLKLRGLIKTTDEVLPLAEPELPLEEVNSNIKTIVTELRYTHF